MCLSVLPQRLWNAPRILANQGVKLCDGISTPDTARPAGPCAGVGQVLVLLVHEVNA